MKTAFQMAFTNANKLRIKDIAYIEKEQSKYCHRNHINIHKMNSFIIKSLFIAGVAVIISCEGRTTFSNIVENQSSETITLNVFTFNGNNKTIIITPAQSKKIYIDDQMGSFVDNSYHCTKELDSIHVTVANNKTLIKDIMDSENWTRDHYDGKNSTEYCFFTISNRDIQ